jgi:hypothetical protein
MNHDYEMRERGRLDIKAAIIVNDLDSMLHRIEELQAHPRYTDALNAVKNAKQAMVDGRSLIHQEYLRERFSKG